MKTVPRKVAVSLRRDEPCSALLPAIWPVDFEDAFTQSGLHGVFQAKTQRLISAERDGYCKAFRGKNGILSNNSFKISFDEKHITSDFLFLAVTSDRIQNWIKRLFNHGGQPHVGHKNIAQVPLAVPSLTEQKKLRIS